MKKLGFLLLMLFVAISAKAQEESTDSMEIQTVIDACINMRDAVGNNDNEALMKATEDLKNCNVDYFHNLEFEEGKNKSLKGHLVFDEVFAEQYSKDADVIKNADQFEVMSASRDRGQTSDGSILTKTICIKANKSAKYKFMASGRQELAAVAEAGGLITLKIHVSNSRGLSENHDDIKDVKNGKPHRKTVFNLPNNPNSKVEVEIFNRTKKDISVVVISN